MNVRREASGPAPLTTARLRYLPGDDAWVWSDEVYDLLGFAPGEVLPSTAVLRAHLDPVGTATLERWTAPAPPVLEEAVAHQLHGTAGPRTVLTAWAALDPTDETGPRDGRLIDLADLIEEAAGRVADQHIRAGLESRSIVDQALGILMAAYGLPDADAFELLRWFSTRRNEKLATIAARLVEGHSGHDEVRTLSAGERDALISALILGDRPPPLEDDRSAGSAIRVDAEPGDATPLIVTGLVDVPRTPDLTRRLDAATRAHPPRLVIDVAGASLCSAAEEELDRVCHRAQRRGHQVEIRR